MASDETAVARLRVDVERDGSTSIVKCGGKLVAGVNDYLYSEVSKLIPDSRKIVLDFTELVMMDSMGLGTIIRLYVSSKAAGCELDLINVGPRIRQLLGLTHVLSLFTACGEHHARLP